MDSQAPSGSAASSLPRVHLPAATIQSGASASTQRPIPRSPHAGCCLGGCCQPRGGGRQAELGPLPQREASETTRQHTRPGRDSRRGVRSLGPSVSCTCAWSVCDLEQTPRWILGEAHKACPCSLMGADTHTEVLGPGGQLLSPGSGPSRGQLMAMAGAHSQEAPPVGTALLPSYDSEHLSYIRKVVKTQNSNKHPYTFHPIHRLYIWPHLPAFPLLHSSLPSSFSPRPPRTHTSGPFGAAVSRLRPCTLQLASLRISTCPSGPQYLVTPEQLIQRHLIRSLYLESPTCSQNVFYSFKVIQGPQGSTDGLGYSPDSPLGQCVSPHVSAFLSHNTF